MNNVIEKIKSALNRLANLDGRHAFLLGLILGISASGIMMYKMDQQYKDEMIEAGIASYVLDHKTGYVIYEGR